MIKSFQVPVSFPFDVSDNPFEIRYNEDMKRSISPISPGNERAEAYSNEMDYNAHGPYFPFVTTDTVPSSNFGQIQAVTVTYTDTYYIYAFDGKLLSEYDQTGSCVRDYIYNGNRLLAEYRPSTGKYYYYMSDQINSTRIITDDAGNVVYSEAYGPYGDVQKTWTKTYDPKQKFSGKEREGYSELDYFGARYFDNNSYRFISVDSIINKAEALANPQLWNLYAYCKNNPITFSDPDGRKYEIAGSKTFEAQINQMIGYLNQSRIASKIIKRLKNAKDTIKITETKILDNTSFSRSDKTIVINPKEGIRIDNGIIQSPALGLLHEMAHASRYLEDPKGYANDLTIDLKSSGFKDMEEFRVITFIETPAAKQIPGEPGRDTQLENGRNRYPGVIVQGPCSRTEQR